MKFPQTIDELHADERNPRVIDDNAARGLSISLSKFGDISGVVFNTKTSCLVCGHQRVQQLKKRFGDELRMKNPERGGDRGYIVCPTGDMFAVRYVDWDEKTQRAANIAANSKVIEGKFTPDVIDLLAGLRDDDETAFDELRFGELENDLFSEEGLSFTPGSFDVAGERQEKFAKIEAMELQPFEHYDYVIILARNMQDWNRMCEMFELRNVRKRESKAVGIGRAVEARVFLEKFDNEDSNRRSESEADEEHEADPAPVA